MIGDFEAQLAAVLGARLPAPFTGRVQLEPGGAGSAPRIVLGVRHAELAEPELGERGEAVVPGATAPRRVVRARCHVQVRVIPEGQGGRAQEMEGLDALIYALDAADFRDGTALATAGDPGFLIRELRIAPALAPLQPAIESPLALTALADGLFWPRGTTGQAGRAIASIVVRGALLPVAIEPADPRPIAGGPEIPLTLRVQLPASASLPFGSLAVALIGPDGGAGAGSLSGGAAGEGGARLLPLSGGVATVTYRPPPRAAADTLIVALDHDARRLGLELGRFRLEVRAS